MAGSSRVLISGIARCISANLTAPYAHKEGQQAKFGVQLGFPKTGQIAIGGQVMDSTDWQDIFTALNECTMEQFQQPREVFDNPAMGIQYPPKFSDGDLTLARDAAGNPIPNTPDPHKAGMWLISAKNADAVGCAGPDAKDIAASAIYRGCWVKCEIEAQAYQTTAGNRVVSLRLINVMKCYDDERFDGRAATHSASSAFATHTVANTNIQAGAGQVMTPIVPPTVGYTAGAQPQPTPNVAAPQMAAPQPAMAAPQPAMAAPAMAAPAMAAPAMAAPQMAAPQMAAPQPQMVAPAPQQVPADPVIMNAGQPPYASFVEKGWTDAAIIADGRGVANFTV
jgi:hypothetical protein